jgi:hypothetical protein
MYATLPVSGGLWTQAKPTTVTSSVPIAPALGVNLNPATTGLFMAAYVDSSSGAAVDYSDWDDGSGSWGTPIHLGVPVPPGPLTPALVYTDVVSTIGTCTSNGLTFSLAYAENVPGQSYYDIYVDVLSLDLIHGCLVPNPKQ